MSISSVVLSKGQEELQGQWKRTGQQGHKLQLAPPVPRLHSRRPKQRQRKGTVPCGRRERIHEPKDPSSTALVPSTLSIVCKARTGHRLHTSTATLLTQLFHPQLTRPSQTEEYSTKLHPNSPPRFSTHSLTHSPTHPSIHRVHNCTTTLSNLAWQKWFFLIYDYT